MHTPLLDAALRNRRKNASMALQKTVRAIPA
jgi:hypothetical protein